jgi:hypothetical protein
MGKGQQGALGIICQRDGPAQKRGKSAGRLKPVEITFAFLLCRNERWFQPVKDAHEKCHCFKNIFIGNL